MMLKNKVAIVTGGTRGIGFAVVKKFIENGAAVSLWGSRQETVDQALEQLKELYPDAKISGKCPSLKDACKLRSNGMPVPLLRNCYSIFNGTKYR